MLRVSEKVVRTIDQRLLYNILEQQEKQTALLERLLETVDVLTMAQDEHTQVLEEIRDLLAGDYEPPVTKTGTINIPGFPSDPLEGFPSIRKESK